MPSDSRARMIRSAAALIGSRGASATSFSDVVNDSGAPRGSIYHHFPEGKRQLAADAVQWTSDRVLASQRGCPADTADGVLGCFIGMWRRVVLSSSGSQGCVVAGVTLDTAPGDDEALDVVRGTFRSWVDLLASQLEHVGVPTDRARPIAVATVAGMEGALILCRAEGGTGPLDIVAAELLHLLPAGLTTALEHP